MFYDKDNNDYYPITDKSIIDDQISYSIDPYVFYYDEYKEKLSIELNREALETDVLNHFYKEFEEQYYYVKYANNKLYIASIPVDKQSYMDGDIQKKN